MSYLSWFLFSFQARSWFLSLGFTLCLGSVLPRVLYAYRVVSWRPETIRKVCVPVLTISRLHVGLGRFSIEQHYGNVFITRLRKKLGNKSSLPKQSHIAVRHHIHPVVSFLYSCFCSHLLPSFFYFHRLISLSWLLFSFTFFYPAYVFALSLNLFFSTKVPWAWMRMMAFFIFIGDVILLITWQIVFKPRAVKELREVRLAEELFQYLFWMI